MDLDRVSVFKPEPWQIAALRDMSPIVLLTGSAGGGKSMCGYEKMVAFALHYPGANCLALRKELDDCARSIIPTLDDKILKGLLGTKSKPNYVSKNVKERYYRFENMSRIWWSGVRTEQDRKSLRSMGAGGSLDFILMEEGIEFDEADIDEVTTRLRGKAAPWQQVVIATNPDTPMHWIYRRLIVGGEASVHMSSAEMNPYNPPKYLERLHNLTGIDKARMAEGMWVEASGVVLDMWRNTFNSYTGQDGGGNVSLLADYIPGGGRVVCTVDDGYTGTYDERNKMFTANSHPRVFLLAQIRANGQLAVFYEDYAIKERYKTQIDRVIGHIQGNGWPKPAETHYDKSSATLRGELVEAGFSPAFPSTSNRDQSIKLLNERVGADANGFRGIIVHPRCRNLILEMSAWAYRNGKPAKEFDHGCFVAGTLVTTDRGDVPVEQIIPGDRVLTRDGYFPVEVATRTGVSVPVITVEFSNGKALTGTPDHPVFLIDGTQRPLNTLRYSDRVLGIPISGDEKCRNTKKETQWLSSIAERRLAGSPASIMKQEPVLSAGQSSQLTDTHLCRPVRVTAVRSSEAENADVYNLAVDGPSEYYANGILVSNCDALRYLQWNLAHGHSHEGAVGVEVPNTEAGRRLAKRLEEIDSALERVEARLAF